MSSFVKCYFVSIEYFVWMFCCLCIRMYGLVALTHWGRVTHLCVGELTIIGSDNGLSPGRRQAIIWTNAGILLIGPWGTKFSKILIGIHTFSFKKIHLKMSSVKWRPFCLGLNVLKQWIKILNPCIWIKFQIQCRLPLYRWLNARL